MNYCEKKIDVIKFENNNKGNNIEFGTEIFERLVLKVKAVAPVLKMKEEDLYFYYERFPDNTSLLALKIKEGKNDRKAFALIGCNSYIMNKKVYCNVEMYSDSGKEAMKMANLLVNDIVQFFQDLENEIYEKNIKCDSLTKIISLSDIKIKPANKSHIKLIDRIFKK